MTNGDKIRSMTDKELQKWLCSIMTAECCDMSCPTKKAHKPGVGLITREQVEKMRGKWIDARYSSKDVPQCQCSICGKKYIGLETDFCQYCGAPMTDKAVDILWKRLEAMHNAD